LGDLTGNGEEWRRGGGVGLWSVPSFSTANFSGNLVAVASTAYAEHIMLPCYLVGDWIGDWIENWIEDWIGDWIPEENP
jgi:hypothetical protein